MKYEAKKKDIMRNYDCYSVSYCGLQTLLSLTNPESYTCGGYGWNADIYNVGNGRAIVTGYRPFGKNVTYELQRAYERKAEKIRHGKRYKTIDGQRKALDKLIQQFMDEVEKAC